MQCDSEIYEKVLSVVKEAAKGNLEPRIVNVNGQQPMGEVAYAINDLLDQMEALMRETKTSIESASQGKTYRNIFNEGFRGLFAINARYLSEGVKGVFQKDKRKSQRYALSLHSLILAAVAKVSLAYSTIFLQALMRWQKLRKCQNPLLKNLMIVCKPLWCYPMELKNYLNFS